VREGVGEITAPFREKKGRESLSAGVVKEGRGGGTCLQGVLWDRVEKNQIALSGRKKRKGGVSENEEVEGRIPHRDMKKREK